MIANQWLVCTWCAELSQGIFYLVGRSPLRVIVMAGLDEARGPGGRSGGARLAAMRPTPSMHVLLSPDLEAMALQAERAGLVGRFTRWMLVNTDLAASREATGAAGRHLANTTVPITVLSPRSDLCCTLRGQRLSPGGGAGGGAGGCICPQRLQELLLPVLADVLGDLATSAKAAGLSLPSGQGGEQGQGQGQSQDPCAALLGQGGRQPNTSSPLLDALQQVVAARPGLLLQRLEVLSQAALLPDLVLGVSVLGAEDAAKGGLEQEAELGEWSPSSGYTPRADMPPLRRFLRVGIVEVRRGIHVSL